MLIPLRTDSPLRAYALGELGDHRGQCDHLRDHGPQSRAGTDRYTLNPAAPRLLEYFTYQFLHANTPHLLFNMLFLYVFGNNVNDRMGNIGYVAFYLAGGVVAGIGYVLFEIHPLLGASGAIAAGDGGVPRAAASLARHDRLLLFSSSASRKSPASG